MAEGEMNTRQAAAHLETTMGYLHNMRHFRTGPAFRQDRAGRVWYATAELDRWDAERQRRWVSADRAE